MESHESWFLETEQEQQIAKQSQTDWMNRDQWIVVDVYNETAKSPVYAFGFAYDINSYSNSIYSLWVKGLMNNIFHTPTSKY